MMVAAKLWYTSTQNNQANLCEVQMYRPVL